MRKFYFWLLLLPLVFSSCDDNSNLASKVSYVPVRVSDYKWSLMNDRGEVVCMDEFDNRPPLVYNGYFPYEEEDGFTLYQIKDGKPMKGTTLAGLESLGYVEDGLVPATVKGHRIGIFDPAGTLKFEIQPIEGKEITECASGYSDGMLKIKNREGEIGYIDDKGNVAVKPSFHDASNFSYGLAIVRGRDGDYNSDDPYEVIDKTGKTKFRLRGGQYPKGTFDSGYLIVDDGDRDIVYDTDGEIYRFPSVVYRIKAANKSFVIFKDDDGRWGVADLKGTILIHPQYDKINFVGSYRFLAEYESNYVILDNHGKILSDLNYSKIEPFGKFGFFAKFSDSRYILIDEKGKQKGKEDFYSYELEKLSYSSSVYSDYNETHLAEENTEWVSEVESVETVNQIDTEVLRKGIRYFVGKIDGKYPVHMKLDLNEGTGVYYYDKYGPGNLMRLSFVLPRVYPCNVELTEYNPDGQYCGVWKGFLDDTGLEGSGVFNGRTMTFELYNCSKEESKL